MSNASTFQLDPYTILTKFKSLGVSQMVKVHRAAFANENRVLIEAAKTQLRGVTHRADTGYTAARKGWTKESTLTAGIWSKVSPNGDSGMVHIMGDFRLKWFEMGTKERVRFRSNNASTGKMRPRPFFARAVASARNQMKEEFEKTIINAVQKRVKG